MGAVPRKASGMARHVARRPPAVRGALLGDVRGEEASYDRQTAAHQSNAGLDESPDCCLIDGDCLMWLALVLLSTEADEEVVKLT